MGVNSPRVITDFEKAEQNAVKDVFPDADLDGCDTHWKRTLRRNKQKFQLIPYENQSKEFQEFNRYFWAPSLVSVQDVIKVGNVYNAII